MDYQETREQNEARFVNAWTQEIDKLRAAVTEALSCESEEEMRSVLSRAIGR